MSFDDALARLGLNRTRLFVLLFFGIAVLLGISTIVATLQTEADKATTAATETDAGR